MADIDMEVYSNAINGMFLFTSSCLVFIMQAGFALLEAGSVRTKNTTNVLIKNWLDACIGAIVYWLFGFGFAYGEGGAAPSFIGASKFALVHNETGVSETELYRDWFFQFVFAATAATIVSGAVAERCTFEAYLSYSIIISGFLYPVVTHWAWTDIGFLKAGQEYEIDNLNFTIGFRDFAGSGVVHLCGGCAAFIATACLGARLDRFDPNHSHHFRPHSIPLLALGGFILLFGFLGFNGGSQITIAGKGEITVVFRVLINTILSGAASGISGMVLMRLPPPFGSGKWSFLYTINATLGGMVAICAGCDAMSFHFGLLTGVIASFVYSMWSRIMTSLRLDDPVDAVAVHGACGFWGVIARSLFDSSDGLLVNGDAKGLLLFSWNLAGGLIIMAWSCGLALLLFGSLKVAGWLRISVEAELIGLDAFKHPMNESAYSFSHHPHQEAASAAAMPEIFTRAYSVTVATASQRRKQIDNGLELAAVHELDSGHENQAMEGDSAEGQEKNPQQSRK